MLDLRIKGLRLAPLLSVCVAATLISSLGLHTVEINHTHPQHTHQHEHSSHGHDGTMVSVGEYIHLAEKKLLLALVVSALAVSILLKPTRRFREQLLIYYRILRARCLLYRVRRRGSLINYLTLYLSRGVLNPKLFRLYTAVPLY
jgi:hypothetical protein